MTLVLLTDYDRSFNAVNQRKVAACIVMYCFLIVEINHINKNQATEGECQLILVLVPSSDKWGEPESGTAPRHNNRLATHMAIDPMRPKIKMKDANRGRRGLNNNCSSLIQMDLISKIPQIINFGYITYLW